VETFFKSKRGIWLPVLTLCGPLGTTIGYSVTGGILSVKTTNSVGDLKGYYDWNVPFYGLFVACCCAFLLILFIPSSYINIDEV